MTDKDFKKEIKSGLSGGYLLYGEEEYLKEFYLSSAVKALIGENSDFGEFNLVKIDEDEFTPQTLSDALSTFPMMSAQICVVCRARLSALSEKDSDALCGVLETLGSYPAVLLMIAPFGGFDAGNVKKNRPSALYKKLTEYLTPVEFGHQSPAMLKKWLMRHFEPEGISAGDGALSLLCEMCDFDMRALASECEKLICYLKANGRDSLGEADVQLLCTEYGEAGAFALSNAIVGGNRTAALAVLEEYKEKRRSSVSVLSAIISDFSNMLTVAVYMKDGLYKAEIAKKTGIHEFRVGRYMDAVSGSDVGTVRMALERCREADLALKTSAVDYIALERLVCTMPSRRQARRSL